MEIFELRYFLGVAKFQNIHKASENLNVSPGSLSKAISRLEDELSIKLFSRHGRNIKITEQGRFFQKRASEIIHLEESVKLELSGHHGIIKTTISGPEILLSKIGVDLVLDFQRHHPKINFEFHTTDDESALNCVMRGESHFALITSDYPSDSDLSTKIITETIFQPIVGKKHPLSALAKHGHSISVEKVLEYSFVSPNNPLLGKVGHKQSLDGWRDDQFPRKIGYSTSSLKIIEELVTQGKAIAYLPDYFAEKIDGYKLKIKGCSYSCKQKVKLVTKKSLEKTWLKHLSYDNSLNTP